MRNHSTRGKNTTKGIASFLALLSFTAYMPVSCLPAFAVDIPANTLPDLNNAINGSVDKIGDNKLNVNVTGGQGTVGQFDWNSFNVGKDANVNWVFSANSQTALNRVLASGGMSYIYGKLTESAANNCPSCVNTSKVILINPSGMLFGNGSQVNLNSFTASTFDIKGAKNIKDMSEAEIAQYAGSDVVRNGVKYHDNGGLFDIAGYNKTVSYVANDNMVDGNGYITSQPGGKLASIVADNSNIKADKTIAMVGNKIDIQNSTLATKYTSANPNVSNAKQNRSGIKLVTGDGVNFVYTTAGNAQNNTTFDRVNKTQNSGYGINIANSDIKTGGFLAYNAVEGDKGSLDISNSTIYTKKLIGTDYTSSSGKHYTAEETGTNGELQLWSDGGINISDSDIQTTNDKNEATGTIVSSGIAYGNIDIQGDGNVNITNTQLRSADTNKNTSADNIKGGNILIRSASGNVNLVQNAATGSDLYNNTAIAAAGNLAIEAENGNVTADGYNKIQAVGHGTANGASSFTDRKIDVISKNTANFNNTVLNAKDINVDSADITVKDSSVVGSNVNLYGNDTTINNSLMQYNNLAFHDGSKTNNVTILNGSTFYDKDSAALEIETNGNLTIGNAELKRKAYSEDDSSVATNQKGITLKSTAGNVTIQGDSDIRSNGGSVSITANAANKKVNINNSTVYAANGNMNISGRGGVNVDSSTVWAKDGNMNINATNGKVSAQYSSIAAEGGNTTIKQGAAMDLNNDFVGSTIASTNKLTLSTNGTASSNYDITGNNLAEGTGKVNNYTDLVSLNDDANDTHFVFADATLEASKNINITDINSAKNVSFVADKGNIALNNAAGMTLTNVSTNAAGNVDIAAGGDLTLNGLDLLGGTKTSLTGDTVKTTDGTAINTNGKKLAINSQKDVNIAVTGVNNKANGLEINADVNTALGSAPLEGKHVTVKANDGTLAIAKIKADTLNLTADTLLKADTTISADTDNVSDLVANGVSLDSKGYLEIRTEGGFNLDNSTTYTPDNGNVKYDQNFGTSTTVEDKVAVGDTYDETNVETTEETNSVLISSNTEKGNEIGRVETDRTLISSVEDPDNAYRENETEYGYTLVTPVENTYEVTEQVTYESVTTNTYEDTKTTTTTTTTDTFQDYEQTTTVKDTQHVATLNDNEQSGFVLVYGKNTVSTENTTEKVNTVTDVKSVDTIVSPEGGRVETIVDSTTNTITESQIKTDVKQEEVRHDCFWEPDVDPDIEPDLGGYDASATIRNPRHAEGTSNAAPVRANITDGKATAVMAAARLVIADEETSEGNAEADDDDDIME